MAGRPFALLFIGDVWGNGIQHKLSTNLYKNLKRASSPRPALVVRSTYRAPVAVRLLVPGEPGRTQKHRLNSGPLIESFLAVDSGTLEGGANPIYLVRQNPSFLLLKGSSLGMKAPPHR